MRIKKLLKILEDLDTSILDLFSSNDNMPNDNNTNLTNLDLESNKSKFMRYDSTPNFSRSNEYGVNSLINFDKNYKSDKTIELDIKNAILQGIGNFEQLNNVDYEIESLEVIQVQDNVKSKSDIDIFSVKIIFEDTLDKDIQNDLMKELTNIDLGTIQIKKFKVIGNRIYFNIYIYR